jgi:hypothetical protein
MMVLFLFCPVYTFADTHQRAFDAQSSVGGEFNVEMCSYSTLGVVNLSVVPAVFFLVVFQSGEKNYSVGWGCPQAFVGILGVEQFVAFGVAVVLNPDNLSTVCAVGQFHNFNFEIVIALLPFVYSYYVVCFVVEGVLRHCRAYAEQYGDDENDTSHILLLLMI